MKANEQVEEMAALDALLFRGDEHPRMLSVVGGLYLLDGEPQPRGLMQALERAARAFPRLRQKVVVPPLRVVLPHWVADPQFALADHLRKVRVPAPGSLREVLDTIRPELSAPLDAEKPLWEALLLTGIDGGRSALFFRMSHAMTDGIGAMRLFEALFDAGSPHGRERIRPAPGHTAPGPIDIQQQALAHLPQGAVNAALRVLPAMLAAARSATRDPASTASAASGYASSLQRVLGLACPPAPVLAGRGFERRCAVLTVPLPRLKRSAHKLGGSINDLYLEAITAALRHYQVAAGVTPADVPVAIPVNLRRGDEPAAGNYIGAITVAAPASEPDLKRRIAAIRDAVKIGRAEPAIRAHSLMAPLMARMPDIALERMLAAIPRADVQASNVPGPAVSPVFAGRRVLAAYPFGPVPGVGAMITMLSVADTCFVAVHFDPASFTRPETFATCLRRGFAEVLEAGGQSGNIGDAVLDHGTSRRRVRARTLVARDRRKRSQQSA